jgi:hypothetical protein
MQTPRIAAATAAFGTAHPTAAAIGAGIMHYGVPTVMLGATYYGASEGLTATPERTTVNIGKVLPELGGFMYGGATGYAALRAADAGYVGFRTTEIKADVFEGEQPKIIPKLQEIQRSGVLNVGEPERAYIFNLQSGKLESIITGERGMVSPYSELMKLPEGGRYGVYHTHTNVPGVFDIVKENVRLARSGEISFGDAAAYTYDFLKNRSEYTAGGGLPSPRDIVSSRGITSEFKTQFGIHSGVVEEGVISSEGINIYSRNRITRPLSEIYETPEAMGKAFINAKIPEEDLFGGYSSGRRKFGSTEQPRTLDRAEQKMMEVYGTLEPHFVSDLIRQMAEERRVSASKNKPFVVDEFREPSMTSLERSDILKKLYPREGVSTATRTTSSSSGSLNTARNLLSKVPEPPMDLGEAALKYGPAGGRPAKYTSTGTGTFRVIESSPTWDAGFRSASIEPRKGFATPEPKMQLQVDPITQGAKALPYKEPIADGLNKRFSGLNIKTEEEFIASRKPSEPVVSYSELQKRGYDWNAALKLSKSERVGAGVPHRTPKTSTYPGVMPYTSVPSALEEAAAAERAFAMPKPQPQQRQQQSPFTAASPAPSTAVKPSPFPATYQQPAASIMTTPQPAPRGSPSPFAPVTPIPFAAITAVTTPRTTPISKPFAPTTPEPYRTVNPFPTPNTKPDTKPSGGHWIRGWETDIPPPPIPPIGLPWGGAGGETPFTRKRRSAFIETFNMGLDMGFLGRKGRAAKSFTTPAKYKRKSAAAKPSSKKSTSRKRK